MKNRKKNHKTHAAAEKNLISSECIASTDPSGRHIVEAKHVEIDNARSL
jgi:hypothetical protein